MTLFWLNTNRLVVIIISRLIAREKYSLSGSYCFEKPSLTLSSSTLWTYPLYTVIGSTLSTDLCTLRQSPRSTDGRFSATPGTCWRIQMLAFFLLCIMFLFLSRLVMVSVRTISPTSSCFYCLACPNLDFCLMFSIGVQFLICLYSLNFVKHFKTRIFSFIISDH